MGATRARVASTVGALVAIVIASAISLAAREAAADGTGVIASGADRARVAAAVAEAIAASPAPGVGARVEADAVGAARGELAAGAVPIETLARFRHARELVDEGWRAYQRVSIELAASRLAVAREEAEPLVALPGGAELYADASLRLGAVLGLQHRADEAHDVIALALALDPGRPVTTAEFSPDVIALVDAVRAAPSPKQHVRLAAEPVGATIAVDGVELGVTPVEADLAQGQHVVVARAPMRPPRAQGVSIDATTTSVRVELEHDVEAEQIAAGADAATTADASRVLVEATMRYAGVDELVLATVSTRRGAPAILLQRCAGAPARCTTVVEVGFAADMSGLREATREAWRAALAAELRYPVTGLTGREVGPIAVTHRCEVCRNPYVIGGVAAGLIVGAIAIAAATSGSRPAPAISVSPPDFGR